jgi:hypothetical protein
MGADSNPVSAGAATRPPVLMIQKREFKDSGENWGDRKKRFLYLFPEIVLIPKLPELSIFSFSTINGQNNL